MSLSKQVQDAVERMCTPLDESVLNGATANSEHVGVKVPYAFGCDNEVHGGKSSLCDDWCGREECVTSDPVANRLRKAENKERERFSTYNKKNGFTYTGDWISSWMNTFRAGYLRGSREATPTYPPAPVAAEECCDVCHKPLSEECACQDAYRSEHDSGAER